MRHPAVFLVTLALSVPVCSQGLSFHDRVTLQSTSEKKFAPAPAQFGATWPDTGSSSYAIDASFKLNVVPLQHVSTLLAGIQIDVHRNTLVDKKTENYKIGSFYDWTVASLNKHPASAVVFGKANYSRDVPGKKGSAEFSLWATPLFRAHFRRPQYFFVPNIISSLTQLLDFTYEPIVGVEAARVRVDSTDEWSNVLRVAGKITGTVYLWPKTHDDRISLSAGAEHRSVLVDPGHLESDDYDLYSFTGSLVMIKTSEVEFGVALTHKNGADASKGFMEQSFTSFTYTLRFL